MVKILKLSSYNINNEISEKMNWNRIGYRLFEKEWYYLQLADHMCYFTLRTAKILE